MFWILLLILLFITLFFLALERRVLAPASLASSVWLIMAVLSAFVGNWNDDWIGLLLIATLILAYGIGALTAQIVASWSDTTKRKKISKPRLPVILCTFALLLPIAAVAVVVPAFSVGLDELDLSSLMVVSSTLTEQRYRGDLLPWHANAPLSAIYLLALVGGWSWWESGSLRIVRFATSFGLLCATAYALLTTARATLFFAFVMFFAAVTTSRLLAQEQGRIRRISIGSVSIAAATITAILLTVFLLGGLIRASHEDLTFVLSKFDAYLGGITGLSDWLLRYDFTQQQWGCLTFAGVADVIGVRAREVGIFQEYFNMPSGSLSNLYTAVRPLVQDFGIVGAHLILYAFGTAAGLAWACLLRGGQWGASGYTVISAIVLASPINDLLAYNTLLAALIVFLMWSGVAYRTDYRILPRV